MVPLLLKESLGPWSYALAGLLLLAGALAGATWGLMLPLPPAEAARFADRGYALQERVSTALEWADREDRTPIVEALVADAAARVGIHLDPNFRNAQGRHGAHFDGVAVTYAQVATKPALHAARTAAAPTLVILHEIHHGGDALSWGDAVREAFEGAARRLALTGPPFRSDTAAIPFVDPRKEQPAGALKG